LNQLNVKTILSASVISNTHVSEGKKVLPKYLVPNDPPLAGQKSKKAPGGIIFSIILAEKSFIIRSPPIDPKSDPGLFKIAPFTKSSGVP